MTRSTRNLVYFTENSLPLISQLLAVNHISQKHVERPEDVMESGTSLFPLSPVKHGGSKLIALQSMTDKCSRRSPLVEEHPAPNVADFFNHGVLLTQE